MIIGRHSLSLFLVICAAPLAFAAPTNGVVVGNVRVMALSPTLVRLEQKGAKGFEDRTTFIVVDRSGPSVMGHIKKVGDAVQVRFPNFRVLVKGGGKVLAGTEVQSPTGKVLYVAPGDKLPAPSFLPAPGSAIGAYVVADHPRIVPPSWGATPAPAGNTLFPATSGWDVGNDAPDLYVFVPGVGGYKTLRSDFLRLTGPSPMIPRWAFGFWDSRWYPYTEEMALDSIDTYRKRGFPLDGFVVDTDWRVNGSDGYEVESKFFPDMPRFIARAHAKNVHLMFNDHPGPIDDALSEKELAFRWAGVSKLLNMGLDVWWYDRNWSTHLREPAPGLQAEIWGQRVFHDMTQRVRPQQRPMTMSNFQGIDNGIRNYAPNPAGHRYPIMWTGDTTAEFEYLQRGIANGVDMGVLALSPYVNEDLGGHINRPTPELYVRYLEYGVFGPITRIHCTRDQDRHPWTYGEDAENIVRDYIKLRYRLLPTIYAASRRSYEDGTPLLRRCDLEWPQYKEASDNQQFLFGDNLLVAPVNESVLGQANLVPVSQFHAPSGEQGLKGEYFLGKELAGKPTLERLDSGVNFNWDDQSPAPGFPRENFSVRWTGTVGPLPEGGQYTLVTQSDDGIRLFVDGKLVLDHWVPQADIEHSTDLKFEKGSTHEIVMEYFQAGGGADASLRWILPSQRRAVASRCLWVPPGEWVDAWTGSVVKGPRVMTINSPLWHTPMYVRSGGLILTAPNTNFVEEKPWTDLAVEAFLATKDGEQTQTLYEDDGLSTGYLTGHFRKTAIRMARKGREVTFRVGPAVGNWSGGVNRRAWTIHLHAPKGSVLRGSGVRKVSALPSTQIGTAPLGWIPAARPDESLYEVKLPATSIQRSVVVTVRIG